MISPVNPNSFRLLETIVNHLVNLPETIEDNLFKAVQEQTRKDYYNHSIKPHKLVRDVRLSILQVGCFISEARYLKHTLGLIIKQIRNNILYYIEIIVLEKYTQVFKDKQCTEFV